MPAVVLDGRHLFSGAQPAPVIVRKLREATAASASRRAAGVVRGVA